MRKNEKMTLCFGIVFIALFAVWTLLVKIIDVQPVGLNGTDIGFTALNLWFHRLTGVHMMLYHITDWLGFVPLFVCMMFGVVGALQLLGRKSIVKVDRDILFLGIYYAVVIIAYLVFEMIPINYRPILIDGYMEASYPSSTTLLVLSVMPTLEFQADRRLKNTVLRKTVRAAAAVFSVFMVAGRLLSGVHWFTDIVGSVMLSEGLFRIYKSVVIIFCSEEKNRRLDNGIQ